MKEITELICKWVILVTLFITFMIFLPFTNISACLGYLDQKTLFAYGILMGSLFGTVITLELNKK